MRFQFSCCLVLAWFASTGCAEVSRVMGPTWHEKCGWEAEDYFDDPQVVALCKAIEANDIAEIDRLVAAGADVNAQGKGKMTPLLWAYPDNELERFKRLLEHGADPNVIIESDFNTRGAMSAGDSVTHLTCKTSFDGYFEAVFDHGGDVNLVNTGRGKITSTPLFLVIESGRPAKKEKLRFLIDEGADVNFINGAELTPAMYATTWGGQYDVALMILQAGADHRTYKPNSNWKLIHSVVSEERRRQSLWTPEQKADYQKLLKWLEDHGESADEAKEDINRWTSWSATTGEYRRKMDAEVAERLKREKQAAEQVQQNEAN